MHDKNIAILVGIGDSHYFNELNIELDELGTLAKTIGYQICDTIIQNLTIPDPKTYVGSGKVEELKTLLDINEADTIICNDTLSPTQIMRLEERLQATIIDRTFLILKIFELRARSKESKLEVSLALKTYMLPRLIGLDASLSRQGGGSFNSKGAGETKLELNRRKLAYEITLIKKELKGILAERMISSKKKNESKIPVVALVGYTNAGKSATMNTLLNILESNKKGVYEKDELFATLDSKTKRLKMKNQPPFLLIDTVGFLAKLPPELISSFYSTLSEIKEANLLIHIVNPIGDYKKEIAVTRDILAHLELDKIERLLVFTRKDITQKSSLINEDYLLVSNTTNEGFDVLISNIYQTINSHLRPYSLKIPYAESKTFDDLKENYKIIKVEFLEEYIMVLADLSDISLQRFKKFINN